MMKKSLWKSTLREIRGSFSRYIAILAIIALGVGFFSGLSVCRNEMIRTADQYLHTYALFDYRLLSTLGLTEEDVAAFRALDGVHDAEGAYNTDVLFSVAGETERVARVHSLTDHINLLSLKAGRLPQLPEECVGDARYFDATDIGKTIDLLSGTDALRYSSYTIVGIADSPYYLNFERGNTSVGNGSVACFLYLLPSSFSSDYYHEIFLTLKEGGEIYSDAYKEAIDRVKDPITSLLDARSDERYQSLRDRIAEAYRTILLSLDSGENSLPSSPEELSALTHERIEDQRQQLQEGTAQAEATIRELETNISELHRTLDAIDNGLYDPTATGKTAEEMRTICQATLVQLNGAMEQAQSTLEALTEAGDAITAADQALVTADDALAELRKPDTYVLTRNANVGYACFESDSSIVAGIAKVFPLFFFLVAALICVTTMTRMMDEERTQIGVLKALGYRSGAILSKYTVYSGSAAVIGCVAGFFLGTFAMPEIIWQAYNIMYGFTPHITYVFHPGLAILSLTAALVCSVGTTLFCYRAEMHSLPALLMRPKAPKTGKRILLERIGFFWKRLSFLRKVSIRNIFRYKKRMIMMILGISGCTALLITGLGINDSIKNIMHYQFDEIMLYDASLSFSEDMTVEAQNAFVQQYRDTLQDICFLSETGADAMATADGEAKSIYLITAEADAIRQMVHFHQGDTALAYPGPGEALLNRALADHLGVTTGDTVIVRTPDLTEFSLRVCGIFDNYIYNYVFLSPETLQESTYHAPVNTAFVTLPENTDVHQALARISEDSSVVSTTISQDLKLRVDNMMSSLDYIVYMVVFCAGALAFIVLYNLTNINITERIREIATIKVLGFYNHETAAYVFRENLVLTAAGALVGLPLGKWLHAFVMSQIRIDLVSFDVRVSWQSYLLSLVLTFFFAWVVSLFMRIKLKKVNMAESLKSME